MKIAKITTHKLEDNYYENVIIDEINNIITEFDELNIYMVNSDDKEILYCLLDTDKVSKMVNTFKKYGLLSKFEMVDHTESFEAFALYESSIMVLDYSPSIGYFQYSLN